jgi:hypothetical protein
MKIGTFQILWRLFGYDSPPFLVRYLKPPPTPDDSAYCWGLVVCGEIMVVFICCLSLFPAEFRVLGPFVTAGGIVLIAVQISQTLGREQRRTRWLDLLLLPYERSDLILYILSDDYFPLLSVFGVVITGMAPFFADLAHRWIVVPLIPLVMIEWLLLQAFGATTGLAGALGRSSTNGTITALLMSVLGMVLRAGLGWLIATSGEVSHTSQYLSLILGPLVSLLAFPPAIGIIVVALYLVALEALIRGLLTYAVNRAGEGIG